MLLNRWLIIPLMKITLTLTIFLLSISTAHAKKRVTCSMFNTQAEAQRYFDAGKRGSRALDRDKDGEPCECLKGGSAYGRSVCSRWRKKYGKR